MGTRVLIGSMRCLELSFTHDYSELTLNFILHLTSNRFRGRVRSLLDFLSDVLARLSVKGVLYVMSAFMPPRGLEAPAVSNALRFRYVYRRNRMMRVAGKDEIFGLRGRGHHFYHPQRRPFSSVCCSLHDFLSDSRLSASERAPDPDTRRERHYAGVSQCAERLIPAGPGWLPCYRAGRA